MTKKENKSAREMFEELGYECFDDRKRDGLPLTIMYRESLRNFDECVAYIIFNLVDKKYNTNLVNVNDNTKLAINKQIEELGWE